MNWDLEVSVLEVYRGEEVVFPDCKQDRVGCFHPEWCLTNELVQG